MAHIVLGDVRAAGAARRESGRLTQQIGADADYRWFEGVLCDQQYRDGNWDEAVEVCDAFLARVDAGDPHYMTAQAACVRAQIRVARGDDAGAVADIDRALEHVRDIRIRSSSTTRPRSRRTFCPSATRSVLPMATEFLDHLRTGGELQFSVIALPAFAAASHRLGLASALGAAVANRGPRRWFNVLRAYGDGDLARAADLLHEIGSLPDEAEARVLAGGDQRETGLAFFRSVGATRFESPG